MLWTQVLNVSQKGTEKDISLTWKIKRVCSNYMCVCVCVCVCVHVCGMLVCMYGNECVLYIYVCMSVLYMCVYVLCVWCMCA